jgi:5-formyltetrahydrofolate cyclo-ligase
MDIDESKSKPIATKVTKDRIRKAILSQRASLDLSECQEKSNKIKERLFKLPEFIQHNNIMLYMALPGEVQTQDMVRETIRLGKRVILPKVAPDGQNLLLSEVKDLDRELKTGMFGILEPKEEFYRPVSLDELNLIILPGVAFDLRGYRIGFGKGFYDRLLSKARTTIITIGLSFDFQLVAEIPAVKHDMKVDKIITERRIICCSLTKESSVVDFWN